MSTDDTTQTARMTPPEPDPVTAPVETVPIGSPATGSTPDTARWSPVDTGPAPDTATSADDTAQAPEPRDPFAPPSPTGGQEPDETRATPSASPGNGTQETVWSASTLPRAEPASRGLRPATMVWGLVLLALGTLLVLIGVGVNMDPILALIALLGAAGLGLVVGAVLPRRRA